MKYALICAIILSGMILPFTCASNEVQDTSSHQSSGEKLIQAAEQKTSDINEIVALTMDEAIRMVIKNNPELKAFEIEIDAASARIIQEKLLPNPSLFIETEDGSFKSFGFGNTYKASIGIMQPVPLGGKISARTDIAMKEKEIVILEYEMKLRDTIAATKKAFMNILVAQQIADIASDNFDIAQKLYDMANIRVEALAAPQTELVKADIELSHAQINLNNAKFELMQTEKLLHNLIGNIDIRIKNYTGEVRHEVPALSSAAIEELIRISYPEILIAQKTRDLAGSHYT